VKKLYCALALGALALLVPLSAGAAGRDGTATTFVVLYEKGASLSSAHEAIERAGRRLLGENRSVGVATVRSSNADFVTDVASSRAVYGRGAQPPGGVRAAGAAPAARPVRDREVGRRRSGWSGAPRERPRAGSRSRTSSGTCG
jgi:hypothetical protein